MRGAGTILALGLLIASLPVQAAGPDIDSRTIIQGRQDPRWREGGLAAETVIPIYEFLSLSADEVGVEGLRVRASFWGLVDLAALQMEERAEGDVNYFYLDYSGLAGALHLRAGRQFLSAGVGLMEQLDGLSVSCRLPLHLRVQAFGGAVTVPQFRGWDQDWLLGGRFSHRLPGLSEIGVSFIHRREGGREARENVGLDLIVEITPRSELDATLVWDDIAGRFRDIDLELIHRFNHDIKYSFDYNRSSPDLYLPHSSIFSVFSEEEHDDVGLNYFFRLGRHSELSADYHRRFLDAGEEGSEVADIFGVRASCRPDPAGRDLMALEARRLTERETGYTQVRLGILYHFLPDLFGYADWNFYYYDETIDGYHFSDNLDLGLGYDRYEPLRFLLSADARSNPYESYAYEVIFKVAYRLPALERRSVGGEGG